MTYSTRFGNISEILISSGLFKRSGKHYFTLCPFHEEKTASLQFTPEGDRSKSGMFRCQGCNESGTGYKLAMKLGLITSKSDIEYSSKKEKEAIPPIDESNHLTLLTTPEGYQPAKSSKWSNGITVTQYLHGAKFRVDRMKKPSGKKDFPCYHKDKSGRFVGGANEMHIPMFNAHHVEASTVKNKAVVLTEGQPDAEACSLSLGLLAVSFTNTATIETKKRDLGVLKAYGVSAILITQDNDPTGQKKLKESVEAATAVGITPILLPLSFFGEELPPGYDLRDWIGEDESTWKDKAAQLKSFFFTEWKLSTSPSKEEEKKEDFGKKEKGEESVHPQIKSNIAAGDTKIVAQKMELDFQRYNSSESIYEKKAIKRELIKTYSLTETDFKELASYSLNRATASISDTENSTSKTEKSPKVKLKKIDELAVGSSGSEEWVIPGLMQVGEFKYLIGSPKVGKSLLFYSLLKASYNSEELLGVPVKEKIKTLLIQFDENERTIKARLELAGIDKDDNVWIVTDGYKLSDIEQLDQLLTETGAELLIIDSLSQFLLAEGLDENKAEAAKPLIGIHKMSQKHNCSVLVVHHANKSSEAKGISRSRGNSSLAAVGDGTLIVDYDPQGGTEGRIITDIPRDGERRAINCFFDFEELDLKLSENEPELVPVYTPDTRNTESAILGLLQANPSGLLQADLAGELGLKTVKMQLSRLKSKQLIYSVQEGKVKRYFLVEETEATSQELEATANLITSSEPAPSKESNRSNEPLPLGGEDSVTSVTSENEERKIKISLEKIEAAEKDLKDKLAQAFTPNPSNSISVKEEKESEAITPDEIISGADLDALKEPTNVEIDSVNIEQVSDDDEPGLWHSTRQELNSLDYRLKMAIRKKESYNIADDFPLIRKAVEELGMSDWKSIARTSLTVTDKIFKHYDLKDWKRFVEYLLYGK